MSGNLTYFIDQIAKDKGPAGSYVTGRVNSPVGQPVTTEKNERRVIKVQGIS